jgi:hypothetical protein
MMVMRCRSDLSCGRLATAQEFQSTVPERPLHAHISL